MTRRHAPRFTQEDLFRCRGCGGWRIRPRRGLSDPCPTCNQRARRELLNGTWGRR